MIKVLIVDDEEWIRLGLREQLDWEGLGFKIIGDAENGAEALELIREDQPDLVITDIRMPIMDGINLMEKLASEFPHIAIIVISGYSEFEYVKKALSYKAVDYVLKPIEEEQLSAIVQKTGAKIRQDRLNHEEWLRLHRRVNESSQIVYNKKWTDFITSAKPQVHEDGMLFEGMRKEFSCSLVSVISVHVINFFSIAHLRFRDDWELLSFAVQNVIQEILGPYPNAFCFRNYRKVSEFVIIFGVESPGQSEQIQGVAQKLKRQLTDFIGQKVNLGLSKAGGWSLAQQLYASSLEAAECACFMQEEGIVAADRLESLNKDYHFPADLLQTFLYCLENGYQSQVFEALDGFFHEVQVQGVHPLRIKESVDEWMDGMGRVEEKFLQNNTDGSGKASNTSHVEWESLQDVQLWFKERTRDILHRIKQAKKRRSPDLIDEVAEYMEHHYHEAIGLAVVAERFFISPAHLSRAFKQKTGQNFNDYLNRLRIDRACELLKDDELRVSDIAEMAGFENANYFMRKFKETTGFTPSEFKKHIKKL